MEEMEAVHAEVEALAAFGPQTPVQRLVAVLLGHDHTSVRSEAQQVPC